MIGVDPERRKLRFLFCEIKVLYSRFLRFLVFLVFLFFLVFLPVSFYMFQPNLFQPTPLERGQQILFEG